MIDVKICGVSDPASLDQAVRKGARYIGFVFFANSPRALSPSAVWALAARVPPGVGRVAVVVDADDALVQAILGEVRFDFVQCHGSETPQRLVDIRARFGTGVIKSVAITDAADLERAAAYQQAADMLLFDSRAPARATRPGGNALSLPWGLLRQRPWRRPWLLAGGLTAANLADAVTASGARAVDVSSGVEDSAGHKSLAKIDAFLELAGRL